MLIAWVGWHQLLDGVREAGHDVRLIPCKEPRLLAWADVAREAGGAPDLVIYVDQSIPPPLLGVESFPCPTLFFCVDSHIHSWYPAWAQAFDLCAVSLKDHLPAFRGRLTDEALLWLPPCPKAGDHPPAPGTEPELEYDLLFVGNVNPETMPGRHAFLKALGARLPGLTVLQGDYRELFPRARLVLNVAERGDLNFRVFEALGCGACLLTPAIGHGLLELFRDGGHLFTYPPGDVEALARLAERLLADEPTRRLVAAAGHAEVNRAHRIPHRAASLLEFIAARATPERMEARLDQAGALRAAMRLLHLHWAEALAGTELAAGYLRAVQRR